MATDHRMWNQQRAEGRALLRVATELRGFLADVPSDDEQGRSLLADCAVLERIGNWLVGTPPVTFSDGESVTGEWAAPAVGEEQK